MTVADVVVTSTVNVVGICVLVEDCSVTVVAAVVAVDGAWLIVVESSGVVVCCAVEVNTLTVGVTLGSSDDVVEDMTGVVDVCEVVVKPASVVDVAPTVNVVGIDVVVVGGCCDSVVNATVEVAIVVDVSTCIVVVSGKTVVVGVSVVIVVTAAVDVAVEVKGVESVCVAVGEEFSGVDVSSTVAVDSVGVVVDACSGELVAVTVM